MPEQSELSALADPYGQRRRRSPSQDEIAGATCIELDVHADPRGSLIALEKAQGLPFALTRVFCIFDVPPGLERANHAVSAHTFLLAINGSLRVVCDNGSEIAKFTLDRRSEGLYVKPGVLLKLSSFTPGTILMVASSEPYAATKYFDKPVFVRENLS